MNKFEEQKKKVINYIGDLKNHYGDEVLDIICDPTDLVNLVSDIQPPQVSELEDIRIFNNVIVYGEVEEIEKEDNDMLVTVRIKDAFKK